MNCVRGPMWLGELVGCVVISLYNLVGGHARRLPSHIKVDADTSLHDGVHFIFHHLVLALLVVFRFP